MRALSSRVARGSSGSTHQWCYAWSGSPTPPSPTSCWHLSADLVAIAGVVAEESMCEVPATSC
jgi:hypothetical protein